MQLPHYITAEVGPEDRVVFFGDAHLQNEPDPSAQARIDRVVRFLAEVRPRAQAVVITGDLFDFYFEYRSVVPAHLLRVLAALEELTRAGVRCYYLAGNHDFWLGRIFGEVLGVTVAREALLLERSAPEGPVRVLAAHGDGLGPGDSGYKLLKKVLRHPLLIGLFRQLHPDWGYAVAHLTSRTSRKYTTRLQPARVEAQADTARRLLEAHPELAAVILGHTHQPQRRQFDRGLYLNPGDWISQFSWVEWTAAGFTLERLQES